MKHKHAELMMEYAKDAMETDMPWLRWEKKIMGIDDEFVGCGGNPSWSDYSKYRRKPRTININGYKVPEPYRGEMKDGDPYYGVSLNSNSECVSEVWYDECYCNRAMLNGLVHLNKDAAMAHTRDLLSFTEA